MSSSEIPWLLTALAQEVLVSRLSHGRTVKKVVLMKNPWSSHACLKASTDISLGALMSMMGKGSSDEVAIVEWSVEGRNAVSNLDRASKAVRTYKRLSQPFKCSTCNWRKLVCMQRMRGRNKCHGTHVPN